MRLFNLARPNVATLVLTVLSILTFVTRFLSPRFFTDLHPQPDAVGIWISFIPRNSRGSIEQFPRLQHAHNDDDRLSLQARFASRRQAHCSDARYLFLLLL